MEKREGKHAPGPWRIVRGLIVDATGRVVQITDNGNREIIAAAPELLAACVRALSFVDSMPDNDNVGLADHLSAVIAKAEGREP